MGLYNTTALLMWQPPFQFGQCVLLFGKLAVIHKTVAVVAMKRKAPMMPMPAPNVSSRMSGPERQSSTKRDWHCSETSQRRHPFGFYFTPYQLRSLLTHSSQTPSCPHIVTPQPLAHTQQEDPIKRRSLSFPRTKKRNPYQYPSAVRERPEGREWKGKYSKY